MKDFTAVSLLMDEVAALRLKKDAADSAYNDAYDAKLRAGEALSDASGKLNEAFYGMLKPA